MRMLQFLIGWVVISLSLNPAYAASSMSALNARVKLVEYAVQFEKTHPLDTRSLSIQWNEILSLISSAEAYANGEACLVLGFKSTFQNNLCKLSSAEGAAAYTDQCSDGTLPCNPTIFGKADSKIFCAPANSGNELSKSCAFETFQYLDQKSNHAIPGFADMSAKTFDIAKLKISEKSPALLSAAQTLFSGKDASLDKAFQFASQLCQDISTGKKTGNQPEDLKTCQKYLSFLEKAKNDAGTSPVVQNKAAQVPAVALPKVLPATPILPLRAPVGTANPAVGALFSKPALATNASTRLNRRPSDGTCAECNVAASAQQVLPPQTTAQISSIVNGIQPAGTFDGAEAFKRIQHLRATLQPTNSEENGFLYMMNMPSNLHRQLKFFQMMPNDADHTTLHIWASEADAQAHPELLGKPSPFPQMWVRYRGGDFVEAGASNVDYPANFQIDSTAHPHLLYEFAQKTVILPSSP
jgi:hypothetical protein